MYKLLRLKDVELCGWRGTISITRQKEKTMRMYPLSLLFLSCKMGIIANLQGCVKDYWDHTWSYYIYARYIKHSQRYWDSQPRPVIQENILLSVWGESATYLYKKGRICPKFRGVSEFIQQKLNAPVMMMVFGGRRLWRGLGQNGAALIKALVHWLKSSWIHGLLRGVLGHKRKLSRTQIALSCLMCPPF